MGGGETGTRGTFDDDSGVNLLDGACLGLGSEEVSVGVAELLGLWSVVAKGE